MEAPAAKSKKDNLVSALLLFLPLALWPAATAVSAWRAGEMPGLVLALTGVALAAVPAVAVGLGQPWGRKVAEAFALAGMIIAILYVLRNGITLLAVPAVGCFVVYAFLSHERFRAADAAKAAKPAEEPPPEHPLAWLKENVEAIAVAFIMALVIRCFCVEVFKIPSSSMEPTLLGDTKERGGDRIMVSKLTYALQPVARFEPVVFKFPLNPMKNYIKRVVGLPDERLMLHRGNVYASPNGSGDRAFRIQRKPLRMQRSLWIPAWSFQRPPLQGEDAFRSYFNTEGPWALKEGVLSGGGSGKTTFYAKAPINDGHLGPNHTGVTVNDLLFEGDLTVRDGSGRFWVRIEHDFGYFDLQLSSSGGSALIHAGNTYPLKTATFPTGSAVHVEFMVYDGQAFVLFDGRVQCTFEFQQTFDETRNFIRERSGLSFEAEAVRFELSGLRIAQDIHYKPKDDVLTGDHPLTIPPGNYFMLGDNVNNSHDGRAWKRHTVRLKTGEVVEYESQEHIDYERRIAWAERRGRKHPPAVLIGADKYGHERAFEEDEIVPNGIDTPRPFYFVESRLIIGRAFAVCWPLSRSLRMIR